VQEATDVTVLMNIQLAPDRGMTMARDTFKKTRSGRSESVIPKWTALGGSAIAVLRVRPGQGRKTRESQEVGVPQGIGFRQVASAIIAKGHIYVTTTHHPYLLSQPSVARGVQ